MNIILDIKSGTYKQLTHKIEERKNQKSFGFAIKISTLKKHGISISKLLDISEDHIIIDAEFDRLDHWLMTSLSTGEIQQEQLRRITITVQVKRADAGEQLVNLQRLDVQVVLVSGHKTYLTLDERKNSGIDLLLRYYEQYANIKFLGVSAKSHEKMNERLSVRIDDTMVLELYGEHKLNNSGLWVFWAGEELSEEAKLYIKRRRDTNGGISFIKTLGRFFIQRKSQVEQYSRNRSVYVYIDLLNEDSFIKILRCLNK